MAAYALSERFPPQADCHIVGNRDPGAYNLLPFIRRPKENKVPFLSGVPREIKMGKLMYTHAIYHEDKPRQICGVTSFKDKCPRFKSDVHKLVSEDIDCEMCSCPLLEPKTDEEICQALVPRKLYKGSVPLTSVKSSQSILMRDHRKNLEGPVFYEAHVNESTAFYHGCKWSRRTSSRGEIRRDQTPGPADYSIVLEPSPQQLCMEQFRFHKRSNTRQLRFMEMVQLRSNLQGGPGPADYDPKWPRCSVVGESTGRAERFPDVVLEERPGPADYDVDGPGPDFNAKSHARKVEPAPFGVKALRFKHRLDESPGPGQYSPRLTKVAGCMQCPPPPFFSSAPRFQPAEDLCDESEDEDERCSECAPKPCVEPTSSFKSRTIRFKPLVKRLDYPSPADLVLLHTSHPRRQRLQYLAPFAASEGRFRPWHDWMPVSDASRTPGPGSYDLTSKPYCVGGGGWTMSGTARFQHIKKTGPPPNSYSVDRGIETVHHTFNRRLRGNVGKNDKFRWRPRGGVEVRSYRSREADLLDKSIHDLEMDPAKATFNLLQQKKIKKEKPERPRRPGESVLLRYFLYDHQFPQL